MRVIAFFLALALTTVFADQTFRIVGNEGTTGFKFNISGTTVVKPTLNVTYGETITFRIENYMNENGIVPFGLTTSVGGSPQDFSTSDMGSLTVSNSSCIPSSTISNSWYINETTLIPCIITWKVVAPAASETKFYYTSRSPTFVGAIEIAGIPATPSSSSSTGGTTAPPSGNGTTTTAPPTTPPSSTGKSGAAVLVPGAAAFIIAAINALFA